MYGVLLLGLALDALRFGHPLIWNISHLQSEQNSSQRFQMAGKTARTSILLINPRSFVFDPLKNLPHCMGVPKVAGTNLLFFPTSTNPSSYSTSYYTAQQLP